MEFKASFKGFWGNEIEQDLRKGKADIIAIQNFIAHYIIGSADASAALKYAQTFKSAGGMDKLMGYISNNAYTQDAAKMTEVLRESPALLQPDESVERAFKFGRDTLLITTKRIILIDKKGLTGKSIAYKSFPLMYNKAFWVETEGHLMDGSEMKVFTDDGHIHQEFARGQNDSMWDVHELLSMKVLNETHPEIVDDEIVFGGDTAGIPVVMGTVIESSF